MGVIRDDNARRRRAQLLDQSQGAVDILEHADRVGHHDVVERTLDRGHGGRILDVTQN